VVQLHAGAGNYLAGQYGRFCLSGRRRNAGAGCQPVQKAPGAVIGSCWENFWMGSRGRKRQRGNLPPSEPIVERPPALR